MENIRKYGNAPFTVAVLHGGPGAAGEMAEVARGLASAYGILEPLFTAESVEGQVEELKDVIKKEAEGPVVLVGFSWGAMLGYIFCAGHQPMVKKLIMVGSGPFEDKYAAGIMNTRLGRLDDKEKEELLTIIDLLQDSSIDNKNVLMTRMGKLIEKADSFDPVQNAGNETTVKFNIYNKVWPQASELRKSGALIDLGKHITCPVTAVHGEYDPHPAEGVKTPLEQVIKNFKFIMLEKCGHRPWAELQAKNMFFEILLDELE